MRPHSLIAFAPRQFHARPASSLAVPLVRSRGAAAAAARTTRPEVTFPVNLPADDARSSPRSRRRRCAWSTACRRFTQQMVDQVFSFGELGFQEFETSKYLTGILEKNGFTVTRGVAGIPTAWVATWGSGKPVISLGSDIDDIPQASQKPGVGYHDPIDRGRAGARRRPQLRRAAEHHRGDRGEEDHGARAHAGHDPALAGRRRGAAGGEGVLRARRACSRTSTSCSSRTSAPTSASRMGTVGQNALISARVQLSRARARTPPARRGAAAARSTPSS